MNEELSRKELEAELHFFRMRAMAGWSKDDWGISAQAMTREAVYGKEVDTGDYPSDHSDLDRCKRCFVAAPSHLQKKMKPRLEKYCTWIEERVKAGDWVGESELDEREKEMLDVYLTLATAKEEPE